MRHLRLLRASTEATTESNLDGRCQPKAAPVLPPLKEHVGPRQRALQRFPRNERCPPRLVERSQQLSGRDGQRSSEPRERPEVDKDRSFFENNLTKAAQFIRPPGRAASSGRAQHGHQTLSPWQAAPPRLLNRTRKIDLPHQPPRPGLYCLHRDHEVGLLLLEVPGQKCRHMKVRAYLLGIEIGSHVFSGDG